MNDPAIVYPVFALAAWTGLVLGLIPVARLRAGRRGLVGTDDFKFGESPAVPPAVRIPNRNYMNLLELPVLFYVACLLIFVTATTTASILALAWAYVAARVLHSVVHLTYNKVVHRLTLFAISNGLLIALWALAWLQLPSRG